MDLAFLRSQFTPLPYPATSFKDQVVIVTGANTGLGLEAARHITRLGASKVIIACRSISKGEEACRSIAESTGRDGVCEAWQVDLASFDSVKEFTRRAEKLDRLDVVVENAGMARGLYTEAEGMETTITVNVVGTFLMALNLLPILRKSGRQHGSVPRLIIVSSEVHAHSKMAERKEDSIFEALNKDDKDYMADRYPTSKLLEVFTVRSLATQMQSGPHANEPVVLNTLNPGLCHSGLARELTGIVAVFFYCMKFLIARTTEMGSRTLVAGAAGGDETHGQYLSDCKVAEVSEFVRSEEGKKTQERVYTELLDILEKIQPGITKNI